MSKVYVIMWKGEEVDETGNREDANYLLNEYNLAFNGGCSLKTRRA